MYLARSRASWSENCSSTASTVSNPPNICLSAGRTIVEGCFRKIQVLVKQKKKSFDDIRGTVYEMISQSCLHINSQHFPFCIQNSERLELISISRETTPWNIPSSTLTRTTCIWRLITWKKMNFNFDICHLPKHVVTKAIKHAEIIYFFSDTAIESLSIYQLTCQFTFYIC